MIATASSSEVPVVFREPHVHTGFRRLNQPWLYYIRSMFQRHNECINTWTHVTALIIVGFKFDGVRQQLDLFHDPYMRPLGALFVTIIALYFCSSSAHCFQNRSEIVHYTCFMIDYCGIGLYGFGSSLAHYFYCSEADTFARFGDLYIVVGATLAVMVCACCSVSKTLYSRPYPLTRRLWQVGSVIAIYAWLILPIAQRIVHYFHSGFYTEGLRHHSEQIVSFCLAGFFFSSDIPQRFFPGGCDFVGHSHQFFHVCIMLTTIKQIDGVVADIQDFRDLIRSRPEPSIGATYGVIALVSLFNIMIMLLFRMYVKSRVLTVSETTVIMQYPGRNGVKSD